VKGKVVVITGATSGVGRAAALELARREASILIVARDRSRAAEVEREILALRTSGAVCTFLADLSSLDEIRRVARELLDYAPQIDVLLNNAGVVERSRTTTADGYETMFATNYLAYYLLTRLLLDRLRESSHARIVNVASEAHRFGSLDWNDLQSDRRYRVFPAYGKSKLAGLMFTYELARRLDGSGDRPGASKKGLLQPRRRRSLADLCANARAWSGNCRVACLIAGSTGDYGQILPRSP
jgi:NAD(P)-dependent dehydrogenase (short-subunit alcohol dehydrogenase family)